MFGLGLIGGGVLIYLLILALPYICLIAITIRTGNTVKELRELKEEIKKLKSKE